MGKYVTNAGLTEYRRLDKIEKDGIRASMIAPADVNAIAGQITLAPSLHEFVRRASPALCDGVYKVKTIRGKSLVWNQQGTRNNQNRINCSVAPSGNYNKYSVTNAGAFAFAEISRTATKVGHKYCVVVRCKSEGGKMLISSAFEGTAKTHEEVDANTPMEYIYFATSANGGNANASVANVTTDNYAATAFYLEREVHDLTQMFGAGKEPTTYEEFLQRKPIVEDEFAYDEGTIVNNKVEKVVSADTDGAEVGVLDLSWVRDIKDENGVSLFEDGMRSAGSAYDEVGSKMAVKRLGFVNLGSLSWVYDSTFAGFRTAGNFTLMVNNAQMVCAKYPYKGAYLYVGDNECGYIYENFIFIKDSAYGTDANAFKAAMQGVQLIYELATPIEVEYAERKMFSPASLGGEEYIVAEGDTTPIPMEAGYPLDLRSLFVSAQSEE